MRGSTTAPSGVPIVLACPGCRAPLPADAGADGEAIRCARCGREGRWRRGIPDLRRSAPPPGVAGHGGEPDPPALDDRAADFRLLLPIRPRAIVLLAGSAGEAVVLGLARAYRWVVALDRDEERIVELRDRAAEEEFHNVQPVLGDPEEPPLPEGAFDAVVWLPPGGGGRPAGRGPGAETPARLGGLLRPGGAFLWAAEGKAGRRTKRLRETGWEAVEVHHALPDPLRPRRMFSASHGAALRYVAAKLDRPRSLPVGFLRSALGDAWWSLELRARRARPGGSLVVARRGAGEAGSPRADAGFLSAVTGLVRERWGSWGLPSPPPRRFEFLLLGHDALRNRTLLLFAPGRSERPLLSVKVARSHEILRRRLRTEHMHLRALESSLPGALRASVPRPLYYGFCWGEVVSVRTGMPGELLWEKVRRDWTLGSGGRVRKNLIECASWLLDLHVATRGPARPIASFHGPDGAPLDAPLRRVREAHPISRFVHELLIHVGEELRQIASVRVSPVWEHGDFWMRNILRSDRGLGVLDWEEGQAAGLPFLDLFRLVHNTAVLRRKEDLRIEPFRRDYERTHFMETWILDVAQPLLAQYAQALQLPREVGRPLFPLFLARLATREFQLTGKAGARDRLAFDCLAVFAERRSQFRWLDEVPPLHQLEMGSPRDHAATDAVG